MTDAAPAGRYRIGLDLGSTASKGVILGPDGAVLARDIVPSGHTPAETAERLAERLSDGLDIPADRLGTVATGYGRNMASLAQKKSLKLPVTPKASVICTRTPPAFSTSAARTPKPSASARTEALWTSP
ncbi:MAG: hypothetical protein LUG50_11905 [Planctomycetaceae bacterium]|nr:hypothetical protein [Planctomycetaceae bacterium]